MSDEPEPQATGSRRSSQGGPLDELRERVAALEAQVFAPTPLHPDASQLQADVRALATQVNATEKWCHEMLGDLQALTGRVGALEESKGNP